MLRACQQTRLHSWTGCGESLGQRASSSTEAGASRKHSRSAMAEQICAIGPADPPLLSSLRIWFLPQRSRSRRHHRTPTRCIIAATLTRSLALALILPLILSLLLSPTLMLAFSPPRHVPQGPPWPQGLAARGVRSRRPGAQSTSARQPKPCGSRWQQSKCFGAKQRRGRNGWCSDDGPRCAALIVG